MSPEFSRVERAETIGEGARDVAVVADEGERAALAARFGLLAIGRLTADFRLWREEVAVRVDGRVRAAVTQACSATGEPLPATVDEPVALRFADHAAADEEIELSADAIDTLPIEGGAINLGEIAAETLALALDPFPRGPGAREALAAAGVLSEEQAGPFAALAALKDRLGAG